jgi:hypothetical protein
MSYFEMRFRFTTNRTKMDPKGMYKTLICFCVPFQRSVKREHMVIKWILRITHMDKNSNIDFAEWIKDGRVLSKYDRQILAIEISFN